MQASKFPKVDRTVRVKSSNSKALTITVNFTEENQLLFETLKSKTNGVLVQTTPEEEQRKIKGFKIKPIAICDPITKYTIKRLRHNHLP